MWARSPLLHKKFALMSDCEEEEGNKKMATAREINANKDKNSV